MKQLIKLVEVLIIGAVVISIIYFLWWVRGAIAPNKQISISGAPKTFRVHALGDIACPPNKIATSNECQQLAVANISKQHKPDAILLLGDLQYDRGELAAFQQSFDVAWREQLQKIYPAPGNHDYGTNGAAGYFEYWNSNKHGSTQAATSEREYYSFDLGNWHIIALNSNCQEIGGCGAGSTQYQWLKSDLADNKSRCTLAFWHHPVFSSGRYKNDSDTKSRGVSFWELLEQYRADVVLNGHDHLYERFAAQSPNGHQNAKGIVEFIIGTGGRSLYKLNAEKAPNHVYGNDQTFGFLELALDSDSYRWWFRSIDNRVLDSGTHNCVP